MDHWHAAVRLDLENEGLRKELDDCRESIKNVVSENRSIRLLATNPLLCAMLCALHRDRKQQLPNDRLELYRACCETLIQRRDIERKIKGDYPEIGYRHKRYLLDDFAYWLIKNGWSQVSITQAIERFDKKIEGMEGLPDKITGQDILRLFIHRTGMLREPVKGHIDFPHLTFQEFMAAQACLDEGDTGVLIKNAHDDQWREVIILAAGLARSSERESIINGIIERGDKERKNKHLLHLLAVGCLETSIEINQQIKNRVRDRLQLLVPPSEIADSKALAQAGDLVVPYLVSKKGMKASVAAACVRTLALVANEHAYKVLHSFISDHRQAVFSEILRIDGIDPTMLLANSRLRTLSKQAKKDAITNRKKKGYGWHFLDKMSVYGRKGFELGIEFLKKNDPDLEELSLEGFEWMGERGLRFLKYFPKLKSINLSDIESLRDISYLCHLDELEELILRSMNEDIDLFHIRRLQNLQKLTLRDSTRRECDDLRGITGLISIDLSNSNINNIIFLSHCLTLHEININHCEQITNLNALGLLKELRVIKVYRESGKLDLRPLEGLPLLKKIELNMSKMKDLYYVPDSLMKFTSPASLPVSIN